MDVSVLLPPEDIEHCGRQLRATLPCDSNDDCSEDKQGNALSGSDPMTEDIHANRGDIGCVALCSPHAPASMVTPFTSSCADINIGSAFYDDSSGNIDDVNAPCIDGEDANTDADAYINTGADANTDAGCLSAILLTTGPTHVGDIHSNNAIDSDGIFRSDSTYYDPVTVTTLDISPSVTSRVTTTPANYPLHIACDKDSEKCHLLEEADLRPAQDARTHDAYAPVHMKVQINEKTHPGTTEGDFGEKIHDLRTPIDSLRSMSAPPASDDYHCHCLCPSADESGQFPLSIHYFAKGDNDDPGETLVPVPASITQSDSLWVLVEGAKSTSNEFVAGSIAALRNANNGADITLSCAEDVDCVDDNIAHTANAIDDDVSAVEGEHAEEPSPHFVDEERTSSPIDDQIYLDDAILGHTDAFEIRMNGAFSLVTDQGARRAQELEENISTLEEEHVSETEEERVQETEASHCEIVNCGEYDSDSSVNQTDIMPTVVQSDDSHLLDVLATVVELGGKPHEDMWDLIAEVLRKRYNSNLYTQQQHDVPLQQRPQGGDVPVGQLRAHRPQERRFDSDVFPLEIDAADLDESSSSPIPVPNAAAGTTLMDTAIGSYKGTIAGAPHYHSNFDNHHQDATGISDCNISDTFSDRRLPWMNAIGGSWRSSEEQSPSTTTSFHINSHMDNDGSISEDQEADEQPLPRRCDLYPEEGDAAAMLESSVQFEVEVAADGTKDVLEISSDSNSIVSNYFSLFDHMIPGLYSTGTSNSAYGLRSRDLLEAMKHCFCCFLPSFPIVYFLCNTNHLILLMIHRLMATLIMYKRNNYHSLLAYLQSVLLLSTGILLKHRRRS
jgi:hypothetical protein